MLQARTQLKLDVQPVVQALSLAVITIDEVDAPVSRFLRSGHVVLFADQPMFGPALAVPLSEPVDVLDGRQYRPGSADVLHPRELHRGKAAQLVEDGRYPLQPLRDDGVFADLRRPVPQRHLERVQGEAVRGAPVADHVERMTDDQSIGADAVPSQQPAGPVDLAARERRRRPLASRLAGKVHGDVGGSDMARTPDRRIIGPVAASPARRRAPPRRGAVGVGIAERLSFFRGAAAIWEGRRGGPGGRARFDRGRPRPARGD